MYQWKTVFSVLAIFCVMTLANHTLAKDHENHGDKPAEEKQAEAKQHPYPLLVDPLGDSLADVEGPLVYVHEGRTLHFANEENLIEFKDEPAKYLEKLDKMIVDTQKPTYPLEKCVVSGEKLGGMGDPIELVHNNRLVQFCCSGCLAKFKKDPDQYLSKLDEAVVKAQKDDYPLDKCVVTEQKLGSMGEPVNDVVGTQLVRFCCKSCIKTFEKNPARYLVMINKQKDDQDANKDQAHPDTDHDEKGHHEHAGQDQE